MIGPNVAIGDGCKLVAHVHIAGHTTIGPARTIYPFASLGTPPQSVHYRGGPTRLTIGARCQIRESVTINIGTEDGGGVTSVGDDCFLMVGSHVGHDCHVGNNVIFANNAVLGGHCEVGDHVFLGGHCAVHQHVRIGESAMVAGYSALRDDVIPLASSCSRSRRLAGINVIGMRRRGLSKEAIRAGAGSLCSCCSRATASSRARIDEVASEVRQRLRGREDHRLHSRTRPSGRSC